MNRNTFRKLIFAAVLAITSAHSFAGVVVSITAVPPPLRVYVQPPCPGEGYIWTPGNWAYRAAGYVWVPGAWVLAPQPGYLFTPGYWAFVDGAYLWHRGYWGPHVGYYGGVNYGFGYPGSGFYGGRWEGGHFFYNRAVSNVGPHFRNTYHEETADHGRDRASFHRDEGRRPDRGERERERPEDRSHRQADRRGGSPRHAAKVASHSGHAEEHHGRR
jgi:hypothetical protein